MLVDRVADYGGAALDLEEITMTIWIDPEEPTEAQRKFMDAVNWFALWVALLIAAITALLTAVERETWAAIWREIGTAMGFAFLCCVAIGGMWL